MWAQQFREVGSQLQQEAMCWVSVDAFQGSVPRERGAWMAVFADSVLGTIGGGHLEWQALMHARQLLASSEASHEEVKRYPLGPALGQCCGGVVMLKFALIGQGQTQVLQDFLTPPQQHVALFGAGHVGHALVNLLSTLPYRVTWVDSRDAVFPEHDSWLIECEHSDPVQSAVKDLAPQSMVLIMSFSHAEDLEVVAQCLKRQRERKDLPYIGLIGSKTKWATFSNRLRERGFSDAELAHITCPIGVPGVQGKEPEVIAVAVTAQLLQRRV